MLTFLFNSLTNNSVPNLMLENSLELAHRDDSM